MELLIDCQVDDAFSGLVDNVDLQTMVAATLRRHAEEFGDEVEVALRITSDEEMLSLIHI